MVIYFFVIFEVLMCVVIIDNICYVIIFRSFLCFYIIFWIWFEVKYFGCECVVFVFLVFDVDWCFGGINFFYVFFGWVVGGILGEDLVVGFFDCIF